MAAASAFEQRVAVWYANGFWDEARVADAVAKGKLSQAAYKRITGKAYKA